ncbi:MAG: hydantoinase B/oxoprolinase family protein, partial [Gammaproteobacteria bacterium]|nr:hydantoinase B/oxoprolinase family protein [Gammaproteobacteria bacterium]
TRNSGGGGWGSPLARDPERVREDVRNGFVSVARAREVYGVVVDAAGLKVDLKATQARRAELQGARR